MKKLVVDSSVIVKWLSTEKEENIVEANKLLQDTLNKKTTLYTSEVARFELGNALWKKKFEINEAQIALGTAHSLPVKFVSETMELAFSSYEIASTYSLTYYDACFLSLAKQLSCPLITANVKHQGKVKEVEVIDLKEYPQSK